MRRMKNKEGGEEKKGILDITKFGISGLAGNQGCQKIPIITIRHA